MEKQIVSAKLKHGIESLFKAVEHFQKKFPENKLFLGVLLQDPITGVMRPAWKGDKQIMAPLLSSEQQPGNQEPDGHAETQAEIDLPEVSAN